MRNYWYPLLFSRELSSSAPHAETLLGDPLVLFRDEQGQARCLLDRCSHRAVPLSLGQVCKGRIECMYHGWQFGGDGACTLIPSLPESAPIPRASRIPTYPCVERMGLVWVWPGDPALAEPEAIPDVPEINDKRYLLVEGVRDFPMDHSLMIENLLDPAHLPFTHDGTISKRSKAQPIEISMLEHPRGLRGRLRHLRDAKEPAQFFTFDPPCTVRLDLDLGKRGYQLIQVHYSVPLARDRMRLIWRLLPNFMTWVPGMRRAMAWNSNRIIDQDVEMLMGQAKRLEQGSKPWLCPTKADALAVRYRAWREQNEDERTWFQGFDREPRATPQRDGKRRLEVA